MSKEDFDLKKSIFETVLNSEVKTPHQPVDITLQEAKDLFVWCHDDKETLENTSPDWKLVEDLPTRTGACGYLRSQWVNEFGSIEAAQK